MSLDLSRFDDNEYRTRLTARIVGRLADLYAITYLCDGRDVVIYLLGVAAELSAGARELARMLTDAAPGSLTQTECHELLARISTCTSNAALFAREAQRHPVDREFRTSPSVF